MIYGLRRFSLRRSGHLRAVIMCEVINYTFTDVPFRRRTECQISHLHLELRAESAIPSCRLTDNQHSTRVYYSATTYGLIAASRVPILASAGKRSVLQFSWTEAFSRVKGIEKHINSSDKFTATK